MSADWNKSFFRPVGTNDGVQILTIIEARDYCEARRPRPCWGWAIRQLTRAALSDDLADVDAAKLAFQSAVLLEGMDLWLARKETVLHHGDPSCRRAPRAAFPAIN
jgi:hypothetical protein